MKALIIILVLAMLACQLPTGAAMTVFSPQDAPQPTPQPTGIIYAIVTAERLEIRSGAGTSYANAGYLTAGSVVRVVGNLDGGTVKCPAGWLQIERGWICAEWVNIAP